MRAMPSMAGGRFQFDMMVGARIELCRYRRVIVSRRVPLLCVSSSLPRGKGSPPAAVGLATRISARCPPYSEHSLLFRVTAEADSGIGGACTDSRRKRPPNKTETLSGTRSTPFLRRTSARQHPSRAADYMTAQPCGRHLLSSCYPAGKTSAILTGRGMTGIGTEQGSAGHRATRRSP